MQLAQYFRSRRATIVPLALICLVRLLIGTLILIITVTLQTRNFITSIDNRVIEDIHYNHGNWDTSEYDADPEVRGNYRLYVLTKDYSKLLTMK